MTNKVEKNLQLNCSTCFSFYQLLETHERESVSCKANCLSQWQAILDKHYQDCIILNLAREEARKEEND